MRTPPVLTCLGIVSVVALLGSGWHWLQKPGRFPIRTIELPAHLQHVRAEELVKSCASELTKGFFGVSLHEVQTCLQQTPWIAQVEVKRVWPDRLAFIIQEQTVLARWAAGGVVNTAGQVLPLKQGSTLNVPLFKGPAGRANLMVERHAALLSTLQPLGLKIASLELTDYGEWKMRLDNGILIIIGKRDVEERVHRFALVYRNALHAHVARIATIDLRYSNGVAISWKEGTLKPSLGEVIQ